MSAPTEIGTLVPNFDRQSRQRFDIKGHGTEAHAKRERRAGRKPCARCLAAETAAHTYRAARRRASASPASKDLEVRSDD